MSRSSLGVGVLTAAIVLSGLMQSTSQRSSADAAKNGPRPAAITLPMTEHDLGIIRELKQWEVPFRVENSGDRRLVLNEVDLACGCGDSLRTVIIAPHASADLLVSLDTRGAAGPIERITSFTTNDPQRPRFDLKVRAVVDAAPVGHDVTARR